MVSCDTGSDAHVEADRLGMCVAVADKEAALNGHPGDKAPVSRIEYCVAASFEDEVYRRRLEADHACALEHSGRAYWDCVRSRNNRTRLDNIVTGKPSENHYPCLNVKPDEETESIREACRAALDYELQVSAVRLLRGESGYGKSPPLCVASLARRYGTDAQKQRSAAICEEAGMNKLWDRLKSLEGKSLRNECVWAGDRSFGSRVEDLCGRVLIATIAEIARSNQTGALIHLSLCRDAHRLAQHYGPKIRSALAGVCTRKVEMWVRAAIDQAAANRAEKRAEVPFACARAFVGLEQPGAGRQALLERLVKACYVDLVPVVAAANGKTCSRQLREMIETIARRNLFAKHPGWRDVFTKHTRCDAVLMTQPR